MNLHLHEEDWGLPRLALVDHDDTDQVDLGDVGEVDVLNEDVVEGAEVPDAHSAHCQILEIRFQGLQKFVFILLLDGRDCWPCLADLENVLGV